MVLLDAQAGICFLLYEPASKMFLLKTSLNLTNLLSRP